MNARSARCALTKALGPPRVRQHASAPAAERGFVNPRTLGGPRVPPSKAEPPLTERAPGPPGMLRRLRNSGYSPVVWCVRSSLLTGHAGASLGALANRQIGSTGRPPGWVEGRRWARRAE